MRSTEEEKQSEGGKGFAGLSSMVSDIENIEVPMAQKTHSSSDLSAEQPSVANHEEPSATPESVSQTSQSPPPASGGFSVGKWAAGIGIVFFLIWLASGTDNKSSTPAPVSSSQST